MYGILQAHIEIGQWSFTQVADLKIGKAVDLLSDHAEVKLPSRFITTDNGTAEELITNQSINVGDPVSVIVWYAGQVHHNEFTGFVKSIKPTIPVEIECEDSIFLLRRKNINKLFVNAQLKEILQEVVAGTGVELSASIPEFKIDRLLIKNANGAKTLETLKDEFGLSIYIDDDGRLFAGLKQQLNALETVEYEFGLNIVEHDLEYKRKEDVRLRVKVIGIAQDNTRTEVEVGEEDGELRTFHFYNVSDKSKLKAIAEAKLSEQQFDGYRGSVTGKLWPYCTRGMGARIIDNLYPQHNGVYHIEKTTLTFSADGTSRQSELGLKISA